ncbi:MAG: sigma-70 family RNA polymerase sigma factor [Imperialibacter sp.]|uniref:RNA polymerase sigma factor n=1 Tax=Imperialibacter sp. TaxID=2038411 RepID=UPI0032EDE9A0
MEATATLERKRPADTMFDDRAAFFEALYEDAFPAAARFVHRMGGDVDDARDVFQDALIVFYEKLAARNAHIETSHKAYLLGICKHLWVRKAKAKSGEVSFEDWEQSMDVPDMNNEHLSARKLLTLLENAGQKCLDLLKSFYYDRLSIQQVATRFGFGSERSATVQKYKCMERVRNEVKSKGWLYEDFTD